MAWRGISFLTFSERQGSRSKTLVTYRTSEVLREYREATLEMPWCVFVISGFVQLSRLVGPRSCRCRVLSGTYQHEDLLVAPGFPIFLMEEERRLCNSTAPGNDYDNNKNNNDNIAGYNTALKCLWKRCLETPCDRTNGKWRICNKSSVDL
mmetsp:Transcript_18215/g.39710  ORF Transcript_18215/g.39710 Transcript_18215/m.39710 type:complete len:151 (+) Transcript_18215:214-666(+)